ncbi:MAG: CoA-transferase [Leptospiraceae bacterium]|nr:CoA-transferase [Leptospiraceae bacterium]
MLNPSKFSYRPKIFENLDEMILEMISPEIHIHFSATISRPNALIYSLARVFHNTKPNFTISMAGIHSSAHAITLSGVAKKIITGFAGDNYPKPGPNPLYSKIMDGQPFEVELWSLLTLVQRLIASSMKLPGFVTRSLVGSDMATDKLGKTLFLLPDPTKVLEGTFNFSEHHIQRAARTETHTSVAFILPLSPDITFIHGSIGDEDGNIIICPPAGEGHWGAMAAKKGVIATVEKIVPRGKLPKELITIPGYKVLAMAEAEYGAHPQSLRVHSFKEIEALGVLGYIDDYEFQEEANKASAIPNLAKHWMERYVLIEGGHKKYLKEVGKVTLRRLHEIPEETVLKDKCDPKTVNDTEQMIILAARAIIEHVERKGYKTILAGIGQAHIAAWTAQRILESKGIFVNVITELGFYNLKPHIGDVFLFSQLHANNSTMLTDISMILGNLVPDECLGVIGAAEIDWFGNINSTKTHKGTFMVGSGGANDIAATADCIVVAKANRYRYVKQVGFITSVGNRVMETICQFGRFRRVPNSDQIFEFTNWLIPPSDDDMEPFEAVLRFTNWLPPDEDAFLKAEKPVTHEELKILRELDPEKIYIEQYAVFTKIP